MSHCKTCTCPEPKIESYLSVSLAALQLGITPQAIRKAIRTGNLRANKIGEAWVIDPNNLDRWAGDRHK